MNGYLNRIHPDRARYIQIVVRYIQTGAEIHQNMGKIHPDRCRDTSRQGLRGGLRPLKKAQLVPWKKPHPLPMYHHLSESPQCKT